MKNFVIIATMLLSMPLVAQTKVVKKTATKSNDFGITYSLPKTTLLIDAEVTQIKRTIGPYYKYADKYLGIKDAIIEDNTSYVLSKVSINNIGIPDEENTFIVSFKPGTVAPYVFLTEDGMLCAINADYEAPITTTTANKKEVTEEINQQSVYSEELLMAGSTSKQAEVAARQIYRIRESRMNILTGEADNTPPDGVAMKLVIQQLEEQERALMALFIGTTVETTTNKFFTIIPTENIDKEVLFRFSTQLGIVPADDLAGSPVYLTLNATDRAPELAPKEAEKKAKSLKGIIYNVPGKADITISMNQKNLCKGSYQITQFGTQEGLAPVLLEDKKAPVKVFFYPETGAIKQIIQ